MSAAVSDTSRSSRIVPHARALWKGCLAGAILAFNLGACRQQTGPSTLVTAEATTATTLSPRPHASPTWRFTARDSGQLTGESSTSMWRSGTADGRSQLISELMLEAYAVQRHRLFEFDTSGALVHYVEHSASTRQRHRDRGPAHIGTIELEFVGGEAVFRARRTGGTPRSIRQWEVDRVLERAELLLRVSSRAQISSANATAPHGAPESHR